MRAAKPIAVIAIAAIAAAPNTAQADEGGISFWLPGTFGSLAAAPQQPGWSTALTYYHTSVSAGGDVARAREITIGNFPANVNANVNAQRQSEFDLHQLCLRVTRAWWPSTANVRPATMLCRQSKHVTRSKSLPASSLASPTAKCAFAATPCRRRNTIMPDQDRVDRRSSRQALVLIL